MRCFPHFEASPKPQFSENEGVFLSEKAREMGIFPAIELVKAHASGTRKKFSAQTLNAESVFLSLVHHEMRGTGWAMKTRKNASSFHDSLLGSKPTPVRLSVLACPTHPVISSWSISMSPQRRTTQTPGASSKKKPKIVNSVKSQKRSSSRST